MASDTSDTNGQPQDSPISRRRVLKQGAAAALGTGATALLGNTVAQAQAPAARPRSSAGRKFRAYVRSGTGASIQELTLLPIRERQIVVRTLASQCCYTITTLALGNTNVAPAIVPGHGGVGIVEEVGPMVKRVQVGDKVIICDTPQCGECYQCLRGRAYRCTSRPDTHPFATMADGTPVHQQINHGSFGELQAVYEEFVVPVFTTVSDVELSLLGCSTATGLSTTMSLAPIEPGSNVVVFGAGAVGLSAIQGARIMGATQIIAVEPIASRRAVAAKVGATTVLDPTAEGAGLVAKIRALCKGPAGSSTRVFAGERDASNAGAGPDYVIECAGGELFPPKSGERGPDPTGVLSLKQAWELAPVGSDLFTVSVGQRGEISFPAGQWSNRGRTHFSGQLGGLTMKRDLPRYVRFMEKGLFDAKALATATFPFERTREAFQASADRSTIGAVVVFS